MSEIDHYRGRGFTWAAHIPQVDCPDVTRLRHLPPVHSPLGARALAAGVRAALGGEDRAPLVRGLVERHWGARDVLLTASGTDALVLALRAAAGGWSEAPVALPAYGCYDLATAADGANLPVVLYDLDPATLAPEPASLARALAAGPCALVVVHLYGVPVDVRGLAAAAEAAGAVLIEDAAQGAGASLGGTPAGALAPVSILSFGRGKGMTGGAGGALLAHDAAGQGIIRRARLRIWGGRRGWRALAGAFAQWILGRPWTYWIPAALPFLRLGETVYHPPVPPCGISRSAAGVLAAGWERSMADAVVRRRSATRLLAALHSAGAQVPRVAADGTAGWLRLPVVLDGEDAERARSADARRLGIMPGYPRALCDLDGFRESVRNAEDGFPGARRLADSLVTLPTHSLLAERDLRALEDWIGGLARAGAGEVVAVADMPAAVEMAGAADGAAVRALSG